MGRGEAGGSNALLFVGSHLTSPTHPFQQVEGLNEARAEQLNRVKITEKEVEALEGAKTEAEALQVGKPPTHPVHSNLPPHPSTHLSNNRPKNESSA